MAYTFRVVSIAAMDICFSRNPEPKERPSFSQVCQYLRQSEDYLLCWSDEDMSVSAGASQLGADHSESQQLYLDLQTKYSSDYS